LECYNKEFTWLDEEGNLRTVKLIPIYVTIKGISSLQLKKIYMKGWQLFAAHMLEAPKDNVSIVDDCAILK